jgi:hypothetical protein
MATNKHGVIIPIGKITRESAAAIRARGGVARTIRATRSDKGKKRK